MIGHAATRKWSARPEGDAAPLTRPFALVEPTLQAVLAGSCREVRRPAGPMLRVLRPGDRLWLREPFHLAERFESWAPSAAVLMGARPTFAVDLARQSRETLLVYGRRRFARELPKAWHRAHLVIVAIRRERLQAIPQAAIRAEGFTNRAAYACAWDRNLGYFSRSPDQVKPGSWATDPEVLVIAFDFVPTPLMSSEVETRGTPRGPTPGDLTSGPARRTEAYRLTTLNPLPIARACPELTAPTLEAGEGRYPAAGRDPCPFCAIRGDLGCAHFAPCGAIETTPRQPIDFPRYNSRIDDATKDAIAADRRAGQTYRAIADRLMISRGAITNVVLERGLRVRARCPR